MSSKDLKIRFESQFSRMNCQMFSCGFSSGHFAGNGISVMLEGTMSRPDKCQPAWSTRRAACAPGAICVAISARWRFIASVLQRGMTSAAPLPSLGQIAPKICGGGSLISGSAGPGAALGPTPGDLVLLADACLVGEPDLYRAGLDALFAPDRFQARGKAFLKSSIAPVA